MKFLLLILMPLSVFAQWDRSAEVHIVGPYVSRQSQDSIIHILGTYVHILDNLNEVLKYQQTVIDSLDIEMTGAAKMAFDNQDDVQGLHKILQFNVTEDNVFRDAINKRLDSIVGILKKCIQVQYMAPYPGDHGYVVPYSETIESDSTIYTDPEAKPTGLHGYDGPLLLHIDSHFTIEGETYYIHKHSREGGYFISKKPIQ